MTTGTAFTEERERKNLLLLMNPRAGTMQASKYLSEIVQMYSDAGYLTTVLMTREQGDGRRFAMRYAAAADIVVVAGGDGTLNGVLDGLISSGVDVPVGYIPSGSTNDFAAGIGLPKSIPAAAERIVTGTPKTFDLGSFNGRHFSYVASFGAFASTSYKVPQNLKNIMGHNAYILQGMRDVFDIRPVSVRIVADEGTPEEHRCEGDYVFGAVCNSTSVGGVLRLNPSDINMNDGKMEVLLIRTPSNLLELNDIVRALLDQKLDAADIEFFRARTLRITMENAVPWTLDGEYEAGAPEIKIETIQSAFRLIV